MPAPPIHVSLSKFKQLEILRAEIDAREEEMRQTERQLRELLFEIERQKLLRAVHPFFQQLPPPDTSQYNHLTTQRESLFDAIQSMRDCVSALEADTAGQTAPPSRMPGRAPAAAPAQGAPKRKFDSFDDFRAARG